MSRSMLPPLRVVLRYEARARMWLFGCVRCGYAKATRHVDALAFPPCECVCLPLVPKGAPRRRTHR